MKQEDAVRACKELRGWCISADVAEYANAPWGSSEAATALLRATKNGYLERRPVEIDGFPGYEYRITSRGRLWLRLLDEDE